MNLVVIVIHDLLAHLGRLPSILRGHAARETNNRDDATVFQRPAPREPPKHRGDGSFHKDLLRWVFAIPIRGCSRGPADLGFSRAGHGL